MGLLPDTQNSGLRMRRECLERFPRYRFQSKLLVSDPDMHHGTCVTHVPWCMSGSRNTGAGGNVPGIPGACATRSFTYLARGPWNNSSWNWSKHTIITETHLRNTSSAAYEVDEVYSWRWSSEFFNLWCRGGISVIITLVLETLHK